MTNPVTIRQATKTAQARCFFARAVVFTIILAIFLPVIGALFESSSDSDFGPAQSGSLFALYHSTLGVILAVLLAPMWLLAFIHNLLGFDLTSQDAVCLLFSSACYGLLLSIIWFVVIRFRSGSHASKIA